MCVTGTNRPAGVLFRLKLESTPEAVRGALKTLSAELTDHLSDDARGTVEIALAEVLNNIVEHAYCNTASGHIDICICPAKNALAFEICDSGCAMPDGGPPKGHPAELGVDMQDLPEGGFGWFLIRTLTTDLRYRREAGRNRLSFQMGID